MNQFHSQIFDMWLAGMTHEQIGGQVGRTKGRIQQILSGIPDYRDPEVKQQRKLNQINARYPASLRLWREGFWIAEISEITGISEGRLRTVIREVYSQEEYDLRKSISRGNWWTENKYTDIDLVRALNQVSVFIGSNQVSVYRYNIVRCAIDLPSPLTITKRFRTWNRAVAIAGLSQSPNGQSRGFGSPTFGRDIMLDAVFRVAEKVGHFPSQDIYEAERMMGEPTGHAIRARFRKWSYVRDLWVDGDSEI